MEIFDGEVECVGQGRTLVGGVENPSEGGVVLPHSAEDTDFTGLRRIEANRDWPDTEVESDLLCAAKDWMIQIEPACGAQSGMASEWNLFGREEDADPDAAFAFDLRSAREDEGGFTEVGLARQGLHLVGGEAASVGEDSECVAFKRALGEDVHLGEAVG